MAPCALPAISGDSASCVQCGECVRGAQQPGEALPCLYLSLTVLCSVYRTRPADLNANDSPAPR